MLNEPIKMVFIVQDVVFIKAKFSVGTSYFASCLKVNYFSMQLYSPGGTFFLDFVVTVKIYPQKFNTKIIT